MMDLKLNNEQLKQVDTKIKTCNRCFGLVEKFENESTIYIGKNKDILLLGEAPANNGWRKSKMLWKDINGKILPSGIIMQKLLSPLDIDLFDLSFVEAIKCYPIKRNYLKRCGLNCKEYLYEQIKLLNPKIVLCLGDAATKCILDIKYKNFREVAGKIYELNTNKKITKIIPIYHPSPISPISYKGNLPIFEKLNNIIS